MLIHDAEVLGTQIDILARDPDGVLAVVEVKSQSKGRLAHLPARQRHRLQRVASLLAQFEPVRLVLVLAEESGRIDLLPVDALTGA